MSITGKPFYPDTQLGELFDVCRNRSRGNPNSAGAFQHVKDRLTEAQERVYKAIKDRGERGATNDELCEVLGLMANQVSPRLTELLMDKRIVERGRRLTRSNCTARVVVAV